MSRVKMLIGACLFICLFQQAKTQPLTEYPIVKNSTTDPASQSLLDQILSVDSIPHGQPERLDFNADDAVDVADIVYRAKAGARAFQFLDRQLDQYHDTFYVYKDFNSGGNHFVPSGMMGDAAGDKHLDFDDAWTDNPAEGLTCIRVNYRPGAGAINWAAQAWQSTQENFGGEDSGYDLIGAPRLVFQARGDAGGEKIIFRIGGANQQPFHDNALSFQDSCESISIGPIELSSEWQEYSFDLLAQESFKVYADRLDGRNHFIPSVRYNGANGLSFDDTSTENPHSGTTCVKVIWDGSAGTDHSKWNGVGWEFPEGRVGFPDEIRQGYDLSGATELSFWVRASENTQVQFVLGHPKDSSGQFPAPGSIPWTSISTQWERKAIPIPPGTDMSNITVGFATFFNDQHDPNSGGFQFYLDDIEINKTLNKDLSALIHGFIWATDAEFLNPGGCTFYLDNIRYELARPDAPRFLQSYVTRSIEDSEFILNNWATSYDNALALIAYTLPGDAESLRRAKLIGDAFLSTIENDPDYTDGRVRNAYRSGDVLDHVSGKVLLHGWWNNNQWNIDPDFLGSKVGDVAWVALALRRLYQVTGEQKYLDAAIQNAEWIEANTRETDGPGGYSGGYGLVDANLGTMGWFGWKSTEHNLDFWKLSEQLYSDTGETKWMERATHAKTFVENMWNTTDTFFYTGTGEDGESINMDLKALDPNTWGLMAFSSDTTETIQYLPLIDWIETNCSVVNCVPIGDDFGYSGFDFNDDQDKVWFEGTAQAALTYLVANRPADWEHWQNEIVLAQQRHPHTDQRGIVAACEDGLSTGLVWQYNARLHVGATCWFIFAEYGYNPFTGQFLRSIP